MHADGVGDVAQDQRSQRRHAVPEEGVLLTNDLGGDFKNSSGALVQRFDQPVGSMQPLGQVILLSLAARRLTHPHVILVVDEDAGQGFRIELNNPAALGLRPHQDVGDHRLRERRIEGVPRLRIERSDLLDHLAHISGIHAAHPDQCGDVAGCQPVCQQWQVVEQSLHRRI